MGTEGCYCRKVNYPHLPAVERKKSGRGLSVEPVILNLGLNDETSFKHRCVTSEDWNKMFKRERTVFCTERES